MEIVFLGTGAAWGLPEHACECEICTKMKELGEHRTRTSLFIRGQEKILVDCGPDVRLQMMQHDVGLPDAVIVTHEHGDHYLGLDELLAFRRAVPKDSWKPVPVYATEKTWEAIEIRFSYLMGTVIQRRDAVPEQPLAGLKMRVVPFRTYHGPTAQGSVGLVFQEKGENGTATVLYTSDFSRVVTQPVLDRNPDVVIFQAHWLNEPRFNRPNHMSFQTGMAHIRRWNARQTTYLVHISDGDLVLGDPHNSAYKKMPPLAALTKPGSDTPYPVPRCQSEWQEVVEEICRDTGIKTSVKVAYDGLRVTVRPGG
ncbi:MAG: MBL fold metallo-hydrolase [Thermodesulfobacteriota bacterium]